MSIPCVRAFFVGLLTLSGLARGQVCGPQWLPGETIATLDNFVRCLGVWDPDGPGSREPVLVAGGQFENAGSTPARHIAMWDGARWYPFGEGMQMFPRAVAVTNDGQLLVGGAFYIEAEDRTVGRVARWDGNSWQQLGEEFDAGVGSLAVGSNGHVYAAGDFKHAGTTASRAIARWDGSAWQPVGTGTEVVDGGAAAVAALPNGDVVLGGRLSWYVDNVRWSHLARWNGSNWLPMGAGPIDSPQCMSVQPDGKLLVGGNFVQLGGISSEPIIRWDGTSWSNIGDLFTGTVNGVSYASDSDIVVVGTIRRGGSYRGIARWNGTAWTQLGSGISPFSNLLDINSVVRFRGEIIAGGQFQTAGDLVSRFIARWTDDHAPWIAVQPVDTAPGPDRSAAFTVELSAGAGEVTYQWRRNSVPLNDEPAFIDGSTSAELKLHNTSACDAGEFDCVVTTACGTVISHAAVLQVCIGDLNGDGLVDDADFVGFVRDYAVLLAGDIAMEAGAPADFDCNGLVDDADFEMFVIAYDEMICP